MPVVPQTKTIPLWLLRDAQGPWLLHRWGHNNKTTQIVDKARAQWEEVHGELEPFNYQRLALRTASDLENSAEELLMAAVGLGGEFEEFLDVSGPIEFGDVQWYLALAWHALEETKPEPRAATPLGHTAPTMLSLEEFSVKEAGLARYVWKLQELAKKAYWHGKPMNAIRPEALELLNKIEVVMARWPNTLGWDYRGVWALNLWKLINRYPEGFESLEEDTNGSK